MNSTTYQVLCSYADPYLLRSHPWPVPATVPFPIKAATAVYIALDDAGLCHYVGSVCRGPGGLADRLAEHLVDPAKRALWHVIWVIPLRPDTTPPEVRRIEGVVGTHLRPRGSRWLPLPRPPSRVGRRLSIRVARP